MCEDSFEIQDLEESFDELITGMSDLMLMFEIIFHLESGLTR